MLSKAGDSIWIKVTCRVNVSRSQTRVLLVSVDLECGALFIFARPWTSLLEGWKRKKKHDMDVMSAAHLGSMHTPSGLCGRPPTEGVRSDGRWSVRSREGRSAVSKHIKENNIIWVIWSDAESISTLSDLLKKMDLPSWIRSYGWRKSASA